MVLDDTKIAAGYRVVSCVKAETALFLKTHTKL